MCQAIATSILFIWLVRFNTYCSEVNTLNFFENVFKTSLENTQNKTTVIYQLFATICFFSFASVFKSPNFLAWNPRIYYRKNSAETDNKKFRDKSEIAPLNFIVLVSVLDSCVLQLCYFVHKVYSHLKIFDFSGHTI